MKGCLKWQHSPSPSPGIECTQSHKSVAFGAQICEQVYTADEWDRTPTEPARKLSYQDLLELKEIQRSLPHANQPADPLSGRAGSHYLSAVPIGLLPLLAENNSDSSSSSSSQNSSPVTSPSPTPNWSSRFSPPPSTRQAPPAPQQWHPPHLAHLLPARPTPQRQKPRFAFLPLLDTPPTSPYPSNPPSPSRSPSPDLHSDVDPPTPSLTNASLDSSPVSRASSCSPEPPSLRLPPPRTRPPMTIPSISPGHQFSNKHGGNDSYFPTFPSSTTSGLASDEPQPGIHPSLAMTMSMRLHAVPSPNLVPPSPLSLGPSSVGNIVPPLKPQRKKRNFIVVNDIEIELDDEEEEEGKKEEEEEVPKSSNVDADLAAPVPEKPTTNRSPEPSPPLALPPSLSYVATKPQITTIPPISILPQLPSSPPPTTNLKIKAASAPASPGTGALHAPICFKRRSPPPSSSSSSLSLCKPGNGNGGKTGSGSNGSCKGFSSSPSSSSPSPLLVPSAS